MESMLSQMSGTQLFFMVLIQLWTIVIFPVIVIRKLNYLTELIESQFEDEESEPQA